MVKEGGNPLFTSTDRPIWIPSREYAEDDAEDAYSKAKNILRTISQFLKEKHKISFNMDYL